MDTPPNSASNTALLDLLLRVSRRLGAEPDRNKLVEGILTEAQALTQSDGGTLYLVDHGRALRFAILRNDSLQLHRGGTSGAPCDLPAVPLYAVDGTRNLANLAARSYWHRRSYRVDDAHESPVDGLDLSGIRAFDTQHNYSTVSLLSVPLINHRDNVLGVMQLVNARAPSNKAPIPFSAAHQTMTEALASLAAVALENQRLLDGQKELLESFIKVIADAIDAKSPYTGTHCARVPILMEMLTRAVCESAAPPFAEFNLTEAEWYEVRIAAWLHDCGKITTPPHVMDKATKLQTIHDRIEEVIARVEVSIAHMRATLLEEVLDGTRTRAHADEALARHESTMRDTTTFLRRINKGAESLATADHERLVALAREYVTIDGVRRPLISPEELDNLLVSRGTLTHEEREVINSHMVHTIDMLEGLPFPPNLARVPEYAGGHHERMDGGGYPRGIHAGTMSIPARVMVIADVFEALTAADRPYKRANTLSETMAIMGAMKRDHHVDPDLFDLFVRSGVYLEFARAHLDPALIDAVDTAALLDITPAPLEIPSPRTRNTTGFLPAYQRFSAAQRKRRS